uniref:TBC1 domain family member 23 n=1 Tax=Cacopsylla melanoneura TaxID=428564 RepID=A0A8D9F8L9_9HEMI
MVEDNSAWMQELELALQEEKQGAEDSLTGPGPIDLEDNVSPANAHQSIAETFRPEVWKKYLDISGKESRVIFSDIYDLPEQNELRNDCKQIVEKLGNDDEDKVSVLSDLESILTQFRKTRSPSRPYTTDNGWIELLFPVVALKLPKQETYNLFEAIHRRYIVRHNDVFHTLTLLILYHDPALSNFLVTKKITSTHVFTKTWFQSLFAAQCNLEVVYAIWDLYFQQEDPFFIFFLALVIIVNARDQIFALKDEPKDKVIEALSLLPCGLERDDVSDFCSLAQYYDYKTPRSFKTELKSCLFENEATSLLNTSILDKTFISQALCLPVSAEELLHYTRHSLDYREDSVRFFLIDCRPALQYNNGHLPTAFHLDSSLMLQEPTAFATAVQGLLSCQRAAIKQGSQAGGEHVCFLGCGQLEEDQYTHMVVSSFLQRQIQFISLVRGGYQSVHSCLEECNSLDDGLVDHNSAECLVCLGSSPSRGSETTPSPSVTTPSSPFARSHSSSDLFGKIGAAMKSKSAEVKEKLIEIISSPSSANANSSPSFKSNSTVNRKPIIGGGSNKRRYRNVAPVFSIDDEHEPQTETSRDSEPDDETIDSVQAWLDKPEVIDSFECQQINMQGYLCDSILLVTETNLIVLRELPERGRGQVELMVNRRLATIGRITTKKKHPEFITFQYGTPNCADPSDMDRCVEEEQRQKQETGNSSETNRTNEPDKSNVSEINRTNESDKSNISETNRTDESDKSNNSETNRINEADKSNNSEASEPSKAS